MLHNAKGETDIARSLLANLKAMEEEDFNNH